MSRRDSALQRQPFAPRNSSALPLFYMYDSRELPLYHEELLGCVAAHRRADFFDDQYATGYWMHWQLRLSQPSLRPLLRLSPALWRSTRRRTRHPWQKFGLAS